MGDINAIYLSSRLVNEKFDGFFSRAKVLNLGAKKKTDRAR